MTPEPEKTKQSVDSVDQLLLGGIVFFVLLMILVSVWEPNDGQTFQVLTGLVTGFTAAFLARLKPSEKPPPPGTTTVTSTRQISTEETK